MTGIQTLGRNIVRTRWATDFGWNAEFGWHEKNAPGPQTEDSWERGFTEVNADNQGKPDGLDPEGVGDIADEGPGRRG